MAEYVRFEVYIPISYTLSAINPKTDQPEDITYSTPPHLIRQFVEDTLGKYRGITQSNPAAAAPFKGWWQAPAKAINETTITIDYLTYVFGLIRMAQLDEAEGHFTAWKENFERDLNQEVIAVLYYPVHTIGDFF